MALEVWDQLKDHYNREQLARNWAKVDAHNHTSAQGVQIPTGGIKPEAITTALLAKENVTFEKLAPGVVRQEKESGPTSFLSWGTVTELGAIAIAGTGDWTVKPNGTGEYEVKWNTPKSNENYVILATSEGSNHTVGVSVASASDFTVRTLTVGTTPAVSNTRFGFLVLSTS